MESMGAFSSQHTLSKVKVKMQARGIWPIAFVQAASSPIRSSKLHFAHQKEAFSGPNAWPPSILSHQPSAIPSHPVPEPIGTADLHGSTFQR